MTIKVNGQPREIAAGATLGDLVAELALRRDGIAIARNADVVPRGSIDTTALADGDAVEIIAAVAGG
jgi:sulfur carrier protein